MACTSPAVTVDRSITPIVIRGSAKRHLPLAMGGAWFVGYGADVGSALLASLEESYCAGIRHFDTGAGYGGGESEKLFARFHAGRRDELYIASKSDPAETTASAMLAEVDGSLRRMRTDYIDLYYIHWPRPGRDMRPAMEGLEKARRQGKVASVGVSNFSVAQMQQVQEVGTIDAHQLGYNLIWRNPERDVIPFCAGHDIAVITYSSLAHGILSGRFGRVLELSAADQRNRIVPFHDDVWPFVYDGVEQLKALAEELGRPLTHLAIRWLLQRPGVSCAIIGARTAEQARTNAEALAGEIPDAAFARMTAISDRIAEHVPAEGNLFYHP